jgi:hypothetical protein
MYMVKVRYSRPFWPHQWPIDIIRNTDQILNSNQDLGIKIAVPVGTLVGQLLFGWLADVYGRKRMCKCDS